MFLFFFFFIFTFFFFFQNSQITIGLFRKKMHGVRMLKMRDRVARLSEELTDENYERVSKRRKKKS